LRLQKRRAGRIALAAIGSMVLPTVDFNNQLLRKANKIDNESINGCLATEFQTRDLATPYSRPKHPLGVSHLPA